MTRRGTHIPPTGFTFRRVRYYIPRGWDVFLAGGVRWRRSRQAWRGFERA
jgi:hypothetical protein